MAHKTLDPVRPQHRSPIVVSYISRILSLSLFHFYKSLPRDLHSPPQLPSSPIVYLCAGFGKNLSENESSSKADWEYSQYTFLLAVIHF